MRFAQTSCQPLDFQSESIAATASRCLESLRERLAPLADAACIMDASVMRYAYSCREQSRILRARGYT